MASTPPGGDANSLDDQQWRQMRRQMPCLQFDPVPETPPLLPRSLYSDEEVEGEESSPIEIASEPSVGRALVLEDLTCHPPSLVETPIFPVGTFPIHTHSVSTMIANESMATLLTSSKPSATTQVPMKTVKADPPSSAITETPPLATVTVPEEDELSFDLNTLETQIADAQDTLRHAMMAAVAAAMTQMRREADLEHRKRDAAHANVVAMLETRVDVLTERHRSREKRDHQDSAVLERFSQHVARCRQREVRCFFLTIVVFEISKSLSIV
ncbi:hypothetical protein Poli38472_006728 [Pythium oligandrum]|uniref:Uncharacterized protein n=1 Tax=Pythium oligandrum TaxID=41045 RepID=A0A8K1C5C9_PYTOL|nr:hypothetical protein Poli38472_006728 [Pythium oligandrum]|eukprot:TMW56718.1 hypothetical protein Poli38472_006728 [Pythium oligandrum]